jgi:light-regulated signal transduction histidine kinase (bacteriophytochrome)
MPNDEEGRLSGKAPWRDSHGTVIGVVCIAQDISARKELEEERERLLTELRRSNEDLAQFSHVVSHDLQAPLRMVRSYTELLARRYEGKFDETADQFISVITKGADGMQQLIQALLRYAQAGEEALSKTAVRVNAILNGVRSNLKLVIDESSAELTHGDLPTVAGDPVQLLQLFQNIIGNAIKYSRAGVPPRINVSAKMEGEQYHFAVSDNGLGIHPKNFERIFAPLKRLHGQEIPGTGIGLAVCKKIVERHGGRIWLSSEPGKGSTFYFTLPKG